jgi:hypothetical protein
MPGEQPLVERTLAYSMPAELLLEYQTLVKAERMGSRLPGEKPGALLLVMYN